MKLNPNFVTHTTNGQQIMVTTGCADFAGMVLSNSSAAFIVDCLKTETTRDEIVDKMFDKYLAPREVIARDVDGVLAKLQEIGAIL